MNQVIRPTKAEVILSTATVESQVVNVSLTRLIGSLYGKMDQMERKLMARIDALEAGFTKNKSATSVDGSNKS